MLNDTGLISVQKGLSILNPKVNIVLLIMINLQKVKSTSIHNKNQETSFLQKKSVMNHL